MTHTDRDILEVVVFLFKNFLRPDGTLPDNQDILVTNLHNVGFPKELIYQAFEWLASLGKQQKFVCEPSKGALRVFTPEETAKINLGCIQFIKLLERKGILNPKSREMVINQLMQLGENVVVADVKWVSLLVLFSQPDQHATLALLEKIILE